MYYTKSIVMQIIFINQTIIILYRAYPFILNSCCCCPLLLLALFDVKLIFLMWGQAGSVRNRSGEFKLAWVNQGLLGCSRVHPDQFKLTWICSGVLWCALVGWPDSGIRLCFDRPAFDMRLASLKWMFVVCVSGGYIYIINNILRSNTSNI